MHKATRLVVLATVVAVAVTFLWSYRVRAAEESAQFAPTRTHALWVPAGTVIHATFRNRLAASSQTGDIVTAFVSVAVVLDDDIVIPIGAPVKGRIEEYARNGANGTAWVDFNRIYARTFPAAIATRRVKVTVPVQSDIEIVGVALRALLGGTFGAAIGATSGDAKLIDRGMLEGAGASLPEMTAVPITITLLTDTNL